MTTVAASSTSAGRASAQRGTVDVFGIAWPRHKAEALAAALIVLAFGLMLTLVIGAASFTPAVLASAAVGVVVWWTARAVHARD